MKRRWVILLLFSVFILVVALFAFTMYFFSASGAVVGEKKPFYVGVTYCGNTAQEAKLLVDRVKDYTNLFVLQSGPIVSNGAAVFEIGDYAVSNELHFAAYFNTVAKYTDLGAWVGMAEERWGSMFAGLYYNDEPGGKMLDAHVEFEPVGNPGNASEGGTGFTVAKNADGAIRLSKSSENFVFKPDGEIQVIKFGVSSWSWGSAASNATTYYPNGTIIFYEVGGDFFTTENGTGLISKLESYEGVLANHPFPDSASVAEAFVDLHRGKLEDLVENWLPERSFPVFTSDYAYYWYDYLSGYDVILAQFGWNNTIAQEIGLVRGAAHLQNKSWGAIITWTYTHPPEYLASGDEIYNQMQAAYGAGADYLVVFNYAEDMEGPYGLLQDEHFNALERFWNEVVQNPKITNGEDGAEAAFVLPQNCGWSLRRPEDLEWGFRVPSEEVQQTFKLLEAALTEHGIRLDIVYADPSFPIAERYPQVYFWGQPAEILHMETFYAILSIFAVVVVIVVLAVAFKKRKSNLNSVA